jgi:pimeloyl-ACP methyl ester carboxylesterase
MSVTLSAAPNYQSKNDDQQIVWMKKSYARDANPSPGYGNQVANGKVYTHIFDKTDEGKYVLISSYINNVESTRQTKRYFVQPQPDQKYSIRSVSPTYTAAKSGDTVTLSVSYQDANKLYAPDRAVSDVVKDNVKWTVKIDGKEELFTVDDMIVFGGRISFKVPAKWNDKEVILRPSLQNTDTVTSKIEIRNVRRKSFFIHGTISDNTRWRDDKLRAESLKSRRVLNIIGFDIPKNDWETFMTPDWEQNNCDYDFSWEKLAGLLNDVRNRTQASNDLVDHVKKRANPADFSEIVLVGHSHGGNVAIQAADRLAKVYKNVYILSIATPAQNRGYLAKPKDIGHTTDGKRIWYYETTNEKNPENPANLICKNQIKHLALWNDKDLVDEAALALETAMPRDAGMTSNSDFFDENGITQNVRFSLDLKGLGKHGFDIFGSAAIMDAVKIGRIKPFTKTRRTQE